MTIATQIVFDATGSNVSHLPPGTAAGYTTGSGGIPWSAAEWAAHPGAVRIDQDAAASDPTADVLDVEAGAATVAECPGWAKRALADYHGARRAGQRSPAIYVSRSSVTNVVNALIAGGVTSGVGLWVADWNNNQAAATAEVAGASGPFPIVGRQFRNAGAYDVSVFSVPWLTTVSAGKPDAPPGQWTDPKAWTWKSAILVGVGLDDKSHSFRFDPAIGDWGRLA